MADARIPIHPNWREEVVVAYEFKTDVFSSREGYETRSALREFPRVTTSFDLVLGRDNDPGWAGLFAANLAKEIGFPDLPRKVLGEAQSGTTVSGDFDDHVFETGSGVFVKAWGKSIHTTIVSNTKTVLTVADSFDADPGDEILVYPETYGRIEGDLTTRHVTSTAGSSSVTMLAYAEQRRVQDLIGWEPVQWYRDRPVLLLAPNWAERVEENWSRPEFSMDPGYGKPWFVPKTKSPIRVSSYAILIRNKEEADELVSFFCYCRGKQASFYAPTWVDDFLFKSPVYSGQTTVKVKGQSALHLAEGSDTYKNIAVRAGRAMHLSGIVDIYADGEDSELVLAEPIPSQFEGATRASWLVRKRFSSDRLELAYRTDSVAEADIKTVSVIETFPVIKFDGFEFTINSDYVTIGSSKDIKSYELNTVDGYNIQIGGDFLE